MVAEDANLRNWRFGTFGDLASRVRNYASRGRESANYGGAILLGLMALEWEEGAQHTTLWRFVTLYSIVSQTGRRSEATAVASNQLLHAEFSAGCRF
jgi:hypothetical protein